MLQEDLSPNSDKGRGAAEAASFKSPFCCPLCLEPETVRFHVDSRREYRHCRVCDLVFVPASFHLNADEEKSRYDLHENDLDDPRYRRFLTPAAEAVVAHVKTGSCGLDYGCGPGPALAQMLEARGYDMSLYDPFYHENPAALDQTYDFITCTETFEHFNKPAAEWRRLVDMLNPGGALIVMTQLRLQERDFGVWRYKDDDTHVAFWSERVFKFLAERENLSLELFARGVVVLRRNT